MWLFGYAIVVDLWMRGFVNWGYAVIRLFGYSIVL